MLTKVRSPLTGEDNLIISHFEVDFVISDPMEILVISKIEIGCNYDSEGNLVVYDFEVF